MKVSKFVELFLMVQFSSYTGSASKPPVSIFQEPNLNIFLKQCIQVVKAQIGQPNSVLPYQQLPDNQEDEKDYELAVILGGVEKGGGYPHQEIYAGKKWGHILITVSDPDPTLQKIDLAQILDKIIGKFNSLVL